MKKLFLTCSFFLALIQSSAISVDSLPTSNSGLLNLLDKELVRRDFYVKQRISHADSISSLIKIQPERAPELYAELGDVIAPVSCDSAIAIYTRGFEAAVAVGDSVLAQNFLIKRASELRKFGATPDAVNSLEDIENVGIYPENRMDYLYAARDLNLYIAEILENSDVAGAYLKAGAEYAKQRLSLLPADSHQAQIEQSLIFYADGKRPLAAATLHPLVSEMDFTDPEYSVAMAILGGQYYYLGLQEEAVRYLAIAALSDIYRGDLKGTALIRLGRALHGQGDLARAHNYLSVALGESILANDKTNIVLVSESIMPVSQEIGHLVRRRFVSMVALVVALVVVIILFVTLHFSNKRRIRDVEHVKRQLANSNMVKETYISEFINLCSSYIGSLEDFTRVCRRKIAAGQTDDLLKYLKDGSMVEEHRKKLDEIFDESFLAIYPTFIEELNRLLLPDKQISVPTANVLTTELRVLAFARLGVDDTARVARFLGVSNNTIYTYRNKFRNMAIERETFDSDILRIGTIA